jgi:glycosyltransferase involved in cell wall biosynthesis
MRILHLCFTRSLYGSERYCADLANRQAASGHQVHVGVAKGSRIPALLRGPVAYQLGLWGRTLGLGRFMRRAAPDIVHAHLSAACKAAARLKGPKRVATLHIRYKPHQHGRLDGLVALTKTEAARVQGYKGVLTPVWNWLPDLADPVPEARARLRLDWGAGEKTLVIGFCGRLHPAKDPGLLIEAFRAAKLADARLVFSGDGPLRGGLERQAAGDPRIVFLGHRGDVAALYRAFDVLVLPSREEPFSLVLLEAMAAGLPILATCTDGPSEFLPCPPATLFNPGDRDTLARLLTQEAAHGPRRTFYDLAPFDPAAQTDRVMNFYRDVLAAS